ncbi:amino acid adenylation domain-containing protein [Pseudoalteromonas sp. T1lg65]|uniref:amino acid adenylation domain-containing protein n=1 Tax=Pseudoalteromonas sp. T1lg65 TaxID=2077101 RepID=UPI003F79C77D
MLSLLAELKDHNLSIWLQDGGLELSFGATAPDATLIGKLKSNKTQLMDYLEAKAVFSKQAFNDLPELNRHPLSFSQERLLFIERLEGGTSAYHIPFLVKLSQHVDLTLLSTAINTVLSRHEVLRSVYLRDDNGNDYQQVIKAEIALKTAPINSLAELNDAVKAVIQVPFNLEKDAMFKTFAWQLGSDTYVLFLWHHIAFDGWSAEIFMRELHQAYFMLAAGKTPELQPLDLQYKDYAKWQRKYIAGEKLEQLLDYWTNQLQGVEQLELYSPLPRPAQFQYQGADYHIDLGAARSTALKDIAKQQQTSLYVVMLSAWALTLQASSGQSKLIIGTPSDNRHLSQTQNLIGFLVNSLALKIDLAAALSFTQVIEQVHHTLLAAKEHQDLPFDKLVDALKLDRDPSRHPLFQMMFALEHFKNNSDDSTQQLFTPLEESQVKSLHKVAKFDISLLLQNGEHSIRGDINYATALYPSEWIATLAKRFELILDQMIANPQQSIKSLNLLDEQAKQQLAQWHDNQHTFNTEYDLACLVEQHAAIKPDALALRTNTGKELSYAELNQKANALAEAIVAAHPNAEQGLLPANTPIALYFSRGPEMLIAILAILKAGGAYVPVSPDYPTSRVEFILTDTDTKLVLTQQQHLAALSPLLVKATALSVDMTALADKVQNPVRPHELQRLAYIIYTSGTTGQPKGVMLSQHNVLYYLHALTSNLGEQYRNIDFSSNYCFDLSVTTTLCPLLAGETICVYEGDILDAAAFQSHLQQQQVGFVKTTPSLAVSLLPGSKCHVQALMLGGEALTEQAIAALAPHVDAIYDEYGPTEATVGAMLAKAYPRAHQGIGRAYPNVNLHILSGSLQPMPVGAPGELYISGPGIAQGYLNREELNQERFIANPFSQHPAHATLYKTGDLARWLDNGDLIYLGRNDEQVKIRGYRVELGEIAAALSAQPGVKQAVVIDIEQTNGKALAAYIVTEPNEAFSITDCKLTLASELPEYMVPSSFTVVDQIPLTGNGKLDRKALPEPTLTAENQYIAPRTELEATLCEVWQQVLGLEQVGIEDNFFQIGGDSIVSIQLVSRLREAEIRVQAKEIFAAPTPARLARLITANAGKQVAIDAEQGTLTGDFDLLPIQQWFFSHQFAKPQHFAQTFAVAMPNSLSDEQLTELLNQLAQQHDMLRVRFKPQTAGFVQTYSEQNTMAPVLTLDAEAVSEKHIETKLTQVQASFELQNGPLWQAVRIKHAMAHKDHLILAFHHLIMDFVSWRILIEDLNSLYVGKSLGNKTSSYRQWVSSLTSYAQQAHQQQQYWQRTLDKNQPSLIASQVAKPQRIVLDAHYTDALLSDANKGYHTEPRDLLLAALSLTLAHLSGDNNHVIALEGHGREAIDEHIDVSRTVGWFTSFYPLALNAGQSVEHAIVDAKESIRQLPDNGVAFGKLFFDKKIKGHLPNVAFNYVGVIAGAPSNPTNMPDFHLVEAKTGQAVSPENQGNYVLDINAAIVNETLTLNCTSKLDDDTFALFEKQFKASLNAVLTHCQKVFNDGAKHTPSDFKLQGVSFTHLTELQNRYDLQAVYPATNLQQGFVFHQLNMPEDTAYRVQSQMQYFDVIDPELYQQAWAKTSEKYPAMRCAFDVEERMLQLIVKHATVDEHNFQFIDLSNLHRNEQQQQIDALALQSLNTPFNFARPGLYSLVLIKRAEQHFHLIKTEHHSICDGWSGPLVMQTVHQYYAQLAGGVTPQVFEDTAYLDSAEYLRDNQGATEAFWQHHMSDLSSANDINALLSTHTDLQALQNNQQPAHLDWTLDEALLTTLRQQCQHHSITLNAAVQFVWHKLLQIYTRDEFTLVGTTIAGRDLPVEGIEQSVGAYINTLPLYLDWPEKATIVEQLQKIQSGILDLNTHSNISLASLQKSSGRLFQSLVVFENYPDLDDQHAEQNKARWQFDAAPEQVEYPLALIAREQNGLSLSLMYDASLLDAERADVLKQQLSLLLSQVAHDPMVMHEQLEVITAAQKVQILEHWNNTQTPLSEHQNVVQLFEQHATLSPTQVAVVDGDLHLTYQQLNLQANQLAAEILEQKQQVMGENVQDDFPVLLFQHKTADSIIAILAILKAGGCYVPLSPDFPESRIEFISRDCGAKLLVTQTGLVDAVEQSCVGALRRLYSDQSLSGSSQTPLDPSIISPQDLAYIIYTSGTTGNPKGVEIPHQALLNYATDTSFIDADKLNNVLSLSSMTFDAFIFDCFVTLTNCGAIHLAEKDTVLDPSKLNAYINTANIDSLFITTALFNRFAKEGLFANSALKQINFGGEAVDVEMVKLVRQQAPDLTLFHAYGPTETTVYATVCRLNSLSDNTAPIGHALANKSAYVLSPAGKLLPAGIIGELYIGGAGMARRYLNRPDLSEQAFIINPYATEWQRQQGWQKMYKTGDLVKWRADGLLEYVGRDDFQVKIRGYRIELGEIETAIKQQADIKDATVRAVEHEGIKRIVAYLVPAQKAEFNERPLREALAQVLPSYMLPSAFMTVPELPVTINGKIDSRALPEPVFTQQDTRVEPSTVLELQLCKIWQHIIGVADIGIEDNFFHIGGDSILSIQLMSALKREGYAISTKDIFEQPTIKQLAAFIEQSSVQVEINAEQGELEGNIPLLAVQEWFLSSHYEDKSHFNQSVMLGLDNKVSLANLEAALTQLHQQHDMLRATYECDGTSWSQRYRDSKQCPVPKLLKWDANTLTFDALQTQLTDVHSSFSLHQGALWQPVYLYNNQDGIDRLAIVIHHLVVDGVSWRVLIEDLTRLLEGATPSAKTSSYRQWAELLAAHPFEPQVEYWQSITQDAPTLDAVHKLERSTLSLEPELTEKLLREAPSGFNTEINDLLMSAFSKAWCETLQVSRCHLTLEGHGREHLQDDIDTSRTVGWFTSLFPVALNYDEDLASLIVNCKETLRHIPDKGLGFGELARRGLLNFDELPKISFNYLGQLDSKAKTTAQTLQMLGEPSGVASAQNNHDDMILSVNAEIRQQALNITFASKLGKTVTDHFKANFVDALNAVIDIACQAANSGGVQTLSDIEPAVIVNPAAQGSGWCLFPPGGGGAESYLQSLGPISEQKLLCFNNIYAAQQVQEDSFAYHFYHFANLAQQYHRHLKQVQPSGPYRLFGWSFGATLAVEVAKLLEKHGDEVSDLVFVDPCFNYRHVNDNVFAQHPQWSSIRPDKINYDYINNAPLRCSANITLFKAGKPVETNADMTQQQLMVNEIINYYCLTPDNLIGEVIADSNITIRQLQQSHNDWIRTPEDLQLVADTLNKV